MSSRKDTLKADNNHNNIHKLFFDNCIKLEKIEDYVTIKARIGWKNLKQSEYVDEGPYLIAGKHINNGNIDWQACDHININRYEESPEIALKNNDIIFSKDGHIGNPIIIKNIDKKATINSTMMLIRPNDKINPDYLLQVLKSKYFHKFINDLSSDGGIPHIFQKDFKNFLIPIPTLENQKKIVNIMDIFEKKIKFIEKTYQNITCYF